MSDSSNRAKSIFLTAIEGYAPDQWPAFLDEACGDDGPLRGRVEQLLRARSALGSFHETAEGTVVQPMREGPGAVIGPYKLLQQIGEGGMGTVYMAEQTQPVQRKVALKLIKSGMDSRQVIARFESERQALALMDHPNIAKVLDAGTTQGSSPYFVMELVKGVPMTRYCDEHHLTPQQRLELFVPVCQAVQHAHQKGIIHRDLKPSNVMVCLYDGKPVPKVIDFGVAKAAGPKLTEKTLFTELGQVVGTPEYMSPEQAELNQLDIDTRSDIYSLGVLLYELLTGTTPLERKRFKAVAFLEMLRLIREEESPKPSTRLSTTDGLPSIAANRGLEPKKLSGLVRGELDWIVMKALDKDRNRRYETANGFAMDVQRYLSDEPVLACPPSASYRLRKFVRRNKAALATSTLVAAALLIGTLVSVWQAVEATDAHRLADERLVLADERLEKEKEARLEADANLQKARDAGEEFFTRVSENRLLDEPGLQPLRKELLEAAVTYYERLAARHSDDCKGQADLTLSSLRLAQIYYTTGFLDRHVSALDKSLDLVEKFVRAHPDAASEHLRLAGFWHGGRGQNTLEPYSGHEQALRVYQKAVAVWERLCERYPSVSGFQSDLSKFYDLQGDMQRHVGQHAEALRTQKKVCQIREQIVRANPDVYHHVPELAHAYVSLARSLEASDPKAAEKLYRQAIALQKDAPDVPAHQEFLAAHQWAFSDFLKQQNRPDEAALARQPAIDIYEKLAVRFPHVGHYKTITSAPWDQLGGVQFGALCASASVHEKRGEFAQAIADYTKALKWHTTAWWIFKRRGLVYFKMGRYAEALADIARAVEIKPDDSSNLTWIDPASVAACPDENFRKGIFELAARAIEKSDSKASAFTTRARLFAAHKKYPEAVADFTKAIELEPSKNAHALNQFAWFLATCPEKKLRDPVRAIDWAKQAVALAPNNGSILNTLGTAQYRVGNWKAAVESLEKSMDLRKGGNAHDWFFLAMAHWQLGDKQQAHKHYDQAIAWMDKNAPQDDELRRFRAEAAELLAIKEKTR